MNIVIDGIIFDLNPNGGIGRWYRETLPRLGDLDSSLAITMLVNRLRYQELPQHQQITIRQIFPPLDTLLRPRSRLYPLINALAPHVKRRCVSDMRNAIWHSSYHTDIANWHGKRVAGIADLIQDHFPEMFVGAFQDDLRRRKREFALRADAVLCISKTTANDVITMYGIPTDRVHVAELAVSPFFHQLNQVPTADPPFLLYVGGRGGYKNFAQVLEAFARWGQRGEVKLRVIGRQWTPIEKEQLTALRITNDVQLEMNVSDEALRLRYNQALALVYPSLYEGFGLPILEAFACGCPVIASDIPTSREIDPDLPIFFDLADSDSLIAAFEMAATLTQITRDQIAQAGHRLAQEYTWEQTALKTLRVYQEISG